jgi:hypothetical protein
VTYSKPPPLLGSKSSIRDPATSTGVGMFGAIESVAPLVGVQASPVGVHDAGEIERVITAFARTPNGGLIVTGSALTALHRDLIITLADRYKLPAIYYERSYGSGRPTSSRNEPRASRCSVVPVTRMMAAITGIALSESLPMSARRPLWANPDIERVEILHRSSLLPTRCAILSVGSTGVFGQ